MLLYVWIACGVSPYHSGISCSENVENIRAARLQESNSNIIRKHIDSETLFNKTGIQMFHYSYVFPRQVHTKIGYYKDSVSKENCIDNYFNEIYLPWVNGDENQKLKIESKYMGVHEFKPHVRGECYTKKFDSTHPESIINSYELLNQRFKEELQNYV